ncbi:hypothetical protein GCM10010985_16260 [Caballeronia grimmiae]|uniref:Uncharacterized protein n=1 Tax=Caballeronia grimmiae TaxID=1071679 RepID=A0ABQ1R9A1_9BURK|nr:hypothetical protein GCM10010985_16260 [Caballeronia grimmiae]
MKKRLWYLWPATGARAFQRNAQLNGKQEAVLVRRTTRQPVLSPQRYATGGIVIVQCRASCSNATAEGGKAAR